MKYSIVIPVYNVSKYLEECIESVLKQSFTDYEIVLVDDGSMDGSEEICDRYAKDDSRIRVIHQKNRGVSVARNKGIEAAIGEFLIFLDSDDFWGDELFLEKVSKYSENADLIVFDFKIISDKDQTKHGKPYDSVKDLKFSYTNGKAFLEDALYKMPDYLWYPYKYVLRSKVWKENHISFPQGRIYEDCATMFLYILKANKVIVLQECFYNYRVFRQGALTSFDTGKTLEDRLLAAVQPIEYLIQQDTLSQELKNILCGNFVSGYYEVLIRSGRLPKEEKKIIFQLLEENKEICKYAVTRKQKVVNSLISIGGIPFTSAILGIRRNLKDKT